ncbi:hypothetical protein [Marinitenerispora sediminis]|uniref:Uncharacterized protein n=1 Tax=Marinitenerispora sediminis TaxID=1931232 RepID=A0A368T579_9ACTN|nr:hypothetical protein [Marinitenerispora sediminis]RCV50698.1 hypothetical protein DEF28_17450 [Marinitenerispora sediminis]RCV56373.1 hypothetical protein DEF23_12730 [Marinitenerispora sediminis]RCV58708.1 hypothetical protein DEF24_12560 [Marinitenerispora sediminis]
MSAATLAEIRRWERARDRPGAVARDLAWWRRQAAEMCRRRWHGAGTGPYYYGYYGCECCEYDAPRGRAGLADVMRALSRRARRELAAVVHAVDARVLAATYGPGPEEDPEWWERCW